MKYRLEIYSIWELGARENQEDSMYPEYGKAKSSDRLFVLCDGMGGHASGEVASGTVCQAMGQSVLKHCPDAEGAFTDEDFMAVLDETFDALDAMDDGSARKMGTTLAFLKLHSRGATVAHIGDSRVYHIRPGKDADETAILFQTRDHSLVNDLVRIGELTPEEAKHSKQKNVITRAMQPCMEYPPKADLYHTQDIRSGDYFMLCSDGILEQMEDGNIRFIFSDKAGMAKGKVDLLKKVTAGNRDNHSAILVHVLDVLDVEPDGSIGKKRRNASSLPVEGKANRKNEAMQLPVERIESSSFPFRWVIVTLVIALLVACVYLVYKYFGLFVFNL